MAKIEGPALVIGGGIGGLSAAIALGRVGVDAIVFEQAPALREVGAAIALWPNAMHTLDQLGVGDAVRERTHGVRYGLGLNAAGAELSRFDVAKLADSASGPRIVHRAELLAALAERVAPDRVRVAKRCVGITQSKEGVRVEFEDGGYAEGAMVIGADGLRSCVRRTVIEDEPRPTGQWCYRGVVETEVEAPDELTEIQGAGLRVGLCPLGPRRLYWWAVEAGPADFSVAREERKRRLLERFAGFPPVFLRYVRETDGDAILLNALMDRAPVDRWHRGAVVLLGDAAHPTTPNLGQGANMAIDDALVLARALRDEPSMAEAFVRYERERVARARHIVTLSRRFGAVAGWSSPTMVSLRELAQRWTPQRVIEREILRQIRENVGAL